MNKLETRKVHKLNIRRNKPTPEDSVSDGYSQLGACKQLSWKAHGDQEQDSGQHPLL